MDVTLQAAALGEQTWTAEGTVTADNKGVANITVSMVNLDDPADLLQVKTGPEGRFGAVLLRPGDYVVFVRSADVSFAAVPVRVGEHRVENVDIRAQAQRSGCSK